MRHFPFGKHKEGLISHSLMSLKEKNKANNNTSVIYMCVYLKIKTNRNSYKTNTEWTCVIQTFKCWLNTLGRWLNGDIMYFRHLRVDIQSLFSWRIDRDSDPVETTPPPKKKNPSKIHVNVDSCIFEEQHSLLLF